MRTLLLLTFLAAASFGSPLFAQKPGKAAPVQPRPEVAAATNTPTQVNGPIVEITTTLGVIKIRLNDDTPLHRDNFLKLAREGFYDSTLFHRVIPNFMIQGGDPDSRKALPGQPLGMGGPGYTVPAEINPVHIHVRGALAAARMGDQVNPAKASSGSQFYLVLGQALNDQMLDQIEKYRGFQYTPEQRAAYLAKGGTPHLDREYTVFGEIIEGLEVIDQVAAQPTRADRPVQDVRMTQVRVVE
jgi:cyclophilin family peptidyl-prolyl cis-trans isomerase